MSNKVEAERKIAEEVEMTNPVGPDNPAIDLVNGADELKLSDIEEGTNSKEAPSVENQQFWKRMSDTHQLSSAKDRSIFTKRDGQDLEWNDLTYTVNHGKSNEKNILTVTFLLFPEFLQT